MTPKKDPLTTFEELLLQLSLGDFDLHRAVNLLLVTALVVGVVFDSSRKQGVDKGSLSQSRLSSNLYFPPLVSMGHPLLFPGPLRSI